MKVLICVHGYPPELVGGTELSARALAHGLVRAGDEVRVVAGTLGGVTTFGVRETTDTEPESGRSFEVLRFERADLYHEHWQKLHSTVVSRAFRGVVRAWRPDVVVVAHWLRLSSDLVRVAAREGVPALVQLSDHTSTCLLSLRVHPGDRAPCTREASSFYCLPCADLVPPRTPWVPLEQRMLAFAERAGGFAAELATARRVVAPSASHAELLARYLGSSAPPIVVCPPTLASLPTRPRAEPPYAGPPQILRLGSWGHSSRAKGAEVLVRAARTLAEDTPVELRLAGSASHAAASDTPEVTRFGAYQPEELSTHPVAAVHLALSGSLAPESHGLVLDEARALGLPAVLPRAGAFEQRAREGGVLLYTPGDAADLAQVLRGLAHEPERLCTLAAGVPAVDGDEAQVRVATLRGLLREVVDDRRALPDNAPEEWFAERMRAEAEARWDEACSQAPPGSLGFETSRASDASND